MLQKLGQDFLPFAFFLRFLVEYRSLARHRLATQESLGIKFERLLPKYCALMLARSLSKMMALVLDSLVEVYMVAYAVVQACFVALDMGTCNQV